MDYLVPIVTSVERQRTELASATLDPESVRVADPATTVVIHNDRAYAAHSVVDTDTAQEFLRQYPDSTALLVQPKE